MSKPDSSDGGTWDSASWEGAARETLLAGARLTLRERLAWIEEMSGYARRLGRNAGAEGRFSSADQAPIEP